MGMDIKMDIVHNKKYIDTNIYTGRDREWFLNMSPDSMMGSKDFEYEFLNINTGIPEDAPDSYEEDCKGWYPTHYYIKVEDFKEWFITYKPHMDAGWISKYDSWRTSKKSYPMENVEIFRTLPLDVNPIDMEFVETVNYYDSALHLFTYLNDFKVPQEAYIVYCFG